MTANEGGSLTFLHVATQQQKGLELNGSIHNVQVSPDGKTVWATVVPGGGHDENKKESHKNLTDAMNMGDHADMMGKNGMNRGDHAKMMSQ